VAEWLRNGLQNRVHQFNSGRGLHPLVLDLFTIFWTVLVGAFRSRRGPPTDDLVHYNLSEIHHQISAILRYLVSRGGCEVASIHLFSNLDRGTLIGRRGFYLAGTTGRCGQPVFF